MYHLLHLATLFAAAGALPAAVPPAGQPAEAPGFDPAVPTTRTRTRTTATGYQTHTQATTHTTRHTGYDTVIMPTDFPSTTTRGDATETDATGTGTTGYNTIIMPTDFPSTTTRGDSTQTDATGSGTGTGTGYDTVIIPTDFPSTTTRGDTTNTNTLTQTNTNTLTQTTATGTGSQYDTTVRPTGIPETTTNGDFPSTTTRRGDEYDTIVPPTGTAIPTTGTLPTTTSGDEYDTIVPPTGTATGVPATAVPSFDPHRPVYDAVIVGGGPAGLSALSALARVRRHVLMIDSGVYRNDATRHMHDVIGYDGVTPAYYRHAARQQISHYPTVRMTNGTVSRIEEHTSEDGQDGNHFNNTLFSVRTTTHDQNGNAGQEHTIHARKIVLATGLRDILPCTPGVEEAWGKGIFWCPWCDGTEHADQRLGLLGNFEDIPGMVREMSTLNRDVYAFTNGTDTPEARQAAEAKFPGSQSYLEMHNVKVDDRRVASITRLRDGGRPAYDASLPTHPEHDLFRVDFADGSHSVQRNAFLANFPDAQRSYVGRDMGVELYGDRMVADQSQGLATNIRGVYAVGDANSDNVTNVPHALFSGKRSAVYLHVQLATEDAEYELAGHNQNGGDNGNGNGNGNDDGTITNYTGNNDVITERRDGRSLDLRAVWEEMNGDKRDLLYAGEFEQ